MTRFDAAQAFYLIQQGFTLSELECAYQAPAERIRLMICEHLAQWIKEELLQIEASNKGSEWGD